MNPQGFVAAALKRVELRPHVDALTGSLAYDARRSGLSNASESRVRVLRTTTYGPRSRALPLPPAESVARERPLALTGVLAERTAPPVVTAGAEEAADELLDYLRARGIPRMTAELASATWPETAGDLRTLVVPVGSLEQHGPHLPLDTDTQVAVALTRGIAQLRDDVVVAPAVPYGASGEHEGFPGTVSVGRDALALYLLEFVRSASATYRRILFVNGHGGNAEPLGRIAEQSRYEGRDARCWTPRVSGGDLHAGRVETSMLLALQPWTVRLSRIAAGNTTPLAQLYPRLRQEGVRAVSDSGVLGDPTGASAEEGWTLYATLVKDLDLFIRSWPA